MDVATRNTLLVVTCLAVLPAAAGAGHPGGHICFATASGCF